VSNQPVYPIPRPDGGDDPRFCFGLACDVVAILAAYGFPPVACSTDFLYWQQHLFTAIYQEKR
jgi:hypothetical protein